jgi:type I restriction enzyme R subunit
MNDNVGKPEKATQERIIRLFHDELGYRYLGDWTDREGNSNIEEELIAKYLEGAGYTEAHISGALQKLRTEATNTHRSLYDNNKAVYSLLRYGVDVQVQAGKPMDKVKLINWDEPQKNDFAIAEEVTLKGGLERRPDLVLYVNGIAVGVIELKNSRVSIGDGIRQLLSNQKPEFNAWFFSTVQIVFAGNDSEGMQYGAIGTPEKYFLKWKEDEQENDSFKLDKYLAKLCRKERLIELMHDFVLFDGGIKKLPRVHQYFGIKAAQQNVRERKGGIIWHTQGSGKSIVMVLLAKWILENKPNARVVVITDRDELDKQIKGVFLDAGETIYRTSSGRDLMKKLGEATPRLLCSLVHKFGRKGVDDFEAFIKQIESQPTKAVGELFVFVDECHRTQSGKLHRAMKAFMPNAVFIGFTGTPLLKKDKQTSHEVFGPYIHTYKFSEAVDDEVVLDLIYEARDIDQMLGSEDKIEAWFEAKTKGLNHWQKDELKKKWGTMQAVLSSKSRIARVVEDIVFDFNVKPRLSSQRGNAILVASSIYEACKYYEAFQRTELKGRCALITSYDPQTKDVTKEDTGANTDTEKETIHKTYTKLLECVQTKPGMTKTESYEDAAKDKFINQPANMKLLIVVDKLLTGFDAPSCTYLYIDKSMQDHGLFQAICRTNRLDGDDKDFGYIVDYMSLLKKVEKAIKVYTSELDDSALGADPTVLVKDRLEKGRERLDEAVEVFALICEPVEPKGELQYIHHFCGNTEIPTDLIEREPRRVMLYKAVASLVRAYANIADELEEAGYSADDIKRIKKTIADAISIRDTVRLASGEVLDLKAYEADMRHLIDTYIEADTARKISPLDNISLLELIVKTGITDAIGQGPENIKGNEEAIAETIENNVRAKIVKEQLTDPAYYEKISKLLDEIIKARKAKADSYEAYLKRIGDLIKNLVQGKGDSTPPSLDTPGRRALYNNLGGNEELALKIDEAVKTHKPDGWRGVEPKERTIKAAIYAIVNDEDEVERLFTIIKAQKEY